MQFNLYIASYSIRRCFLKLHNLLRVQKKFREMKGLGSIHYEMILLLLLLLLLLLIFKPSLNSMPLWLLIGKAQNHSRNGQLFFKGI